MSEQTLPIQTVQLKQDDLKDPTLGQLNNLFASLQNQINALSGAAGKTVLPQGVDTQGSTVTNVGEPTGPTDAVSKGHAEANYSAQALAPKLESGGSTGLKSYRALNSKSQQETNSVFLQSIMNTAPTANSSILSATTPSGGSTAVTISAGQHVYVSGKIVTYAQRTDTLTLPTSFTITAISRSGGVVTATVTGTPPYTTGDTVAIAGVTDTSFDGTFQLVSATGSTLVWNQIGANATSSGGTTSTGNCYFYFLSLNSKTLALAGPFAEDTQFIRTQVNIDGTVLIATVVLNGSGIDLTQSAAGNTPPAATGNARILTRL